MNFESNEAMLQNSIPPLEKNLIVLCGPTASGKTSLAVEIAAQCNGEIISADSRQVYKYMDLGTGKDLCDYNHKNGNIPYHLIDIAEPSDMYTLFHFKQDFFKSFSEIRSRKKYPVMAGGTGLYIEAVLKNYDIPPVPEDPVLRSELMQKEKNWLEQELQKLDPDQFRKTDLSSKKRIVRALEIVRTRDKYPSVVGIANTPLLNPIILCIRWNRQILRERIDRRLEARLKQGMVDEVRKLLQSGIPRARFALFGMEYKHVAQYLDGEIRYEKMVEELKTSIHQLAKRQDTWFRGMERRGTKIFWVDNADINTAIKILKDNQIQITKCPHRDKSSDI